MGQFQERGLIPPVVDDLFPHTVVNVFVCLCRFLKGYLVSKMIEPFDVTSRYLVFSSLVQIISAKLLVGTSVFQYVVAHDEEKKQ